LEGVFAIFSKDDSVVKLAPNSDSEFLASNRLFQHLNSDRVLLRISVLL